MPWKVEPNFRLPEGFELWEDVHEVELRYKGKSVGTFLQENATRKVILKRCLEYVGEQGFQDGPYYF